MAVKDIWKHPRWGAEIEAINISGLKACVFSSQEALFRMNGAASGNVDDA